MTSQPGTPRSQRRRGLNRAANKRTDVESDALEVLVELLAGHAIRMGLVASDIRRLFDLALYNKATELHRHTHKKPNHSQIAAQTGLTRTQIRSFTLSAARNETSQLSSRSKLALTYQAVVRRAARTSPNRRVVELSYRKGKFNFVSVAKTISGDIPPGALLKEMVRRGLAQICNKKARGRTVLLRRKVVTDHAEMPPLVELLVSLQRTPLSGHNKDIGAVQVKEMLLPNRLAAIQLANKLDLMNLAFFDAIEPNFSTNGSSKIQDRSSRFPMKIAIARWAPQ